MTIGISFLAVVISAFACYATIRSQKEQREHNKLSVMPNLIIDCDLDPSQEIAISVSNGGIGPARFIKIQYEFLNELKENNGDWGFDHVVSKMQTFDMLVVCTNREQGKSIIPGDRKSIFALRPQNGETAFNGKDFDYFRLFAESVKITILYESFYGDRPRPEIFDGSEMV